MTCYLFGLPKSEPLSRNTLARCQRALLGRSAQDVSRLLSLSTLKPSAGSSLSVHLCVYVFQSGRSKRARGAVWKEHAQSKYVSNVAWRSLHDKFLLDRRRPCLLLSPTVVASCRQSAKSGEPGELSCKTHRKHATPKTQLCPSCVQI